MRILITNDDGINAPGLEVLTEIGLELAGPEGEVWTVAPAFEQSGGGALHQLYPSNDDRQIGTPSLCGRG